MKASDAKVNSVMCAQCTASHLEQMAKREANRGSSCCDTLAIRLAPAQRVAAVSGA